MYVNAILVYRGAYILNELLISDRCIFAHSYLNKLYNSECEKNYMFIADISKVDMYMHSNVRVAHCI